MRFGTYFFLQAPPGRTDAQILTEEVNQMVLAEELGFDSVWLTEHHYADYGLSSAPSVLLATVDRLSGGRVELGIGAGWLEDEFQALGSDFATRGPRTDEHLEVLRALWRDEIASYHGATVAFDRIKLTTRPLQPGGVPIIVGGHSPPALRRAGRYGTRFSPR